MPHPWFSRRVVYPLHERLLKRPTFAYLESLEASQWLSRADLERLQARKLTRLLQTSARHSPWHAERIQAHDIVEAFHDDDAAAGNRLPVSCFL